MSALKCFLSDLDLLSDHRPEVSLLFLHFLNFAHKIVTTAKIASVFAVDILQLKLFL